MAMPRHAVERISELLGGRRVLGKDLGSHLEFVPLLRDGLPYEALGVVTRILGISVDAASAWLRLPRRTLARRKENNRLDPQQSERVLRLAELTARALATFGSVQETGRWLFTENGALGGVIPLALLDTDVGTRAAQDALLRVYNGVYDESCQLFPLTEGVREDAAVSTKDDRGRTKRSPLS